MAFKFSKTPLVWLVIAVFIVKEAAWLAVIPPREAPDELGHYAYIESLYYEKKPPRVGETVFSQRVEVAGGPAVNATAVDTADYIPGRQLNWIAQHPPAYYLLLLPLFSVLPHDNVLFSIFVLRFTSILLGAAAIYFIFKTLHKLLPGQDMINTAVAGAIAFLPMFSFMSAALNNDNFVMALSAALFYLLTCAPDKARPSCAKSISWSLQVGLILALLALTKVSALPIFVTVFIIQAVYFFRAKGRANRRRHLHDTIVIFAVPLVLAAWWYVGNYMHFGTFFPEMKDAVAANPQILDSNPEITRIFPETGPHEQTPVGIMEFLFNKGFLVEYLKNIWGVFGRFFIQLTAWQYAAIFIFMGAGVLGWIAEAFRKHRALKLTKILFSDEMVSLFIVLLFLFVIGQRVYGITVERGFLGAMHGRYFFPALPAFFYLLIKGWSRLLPTGWHGAAFAAMIILFIFNDMGTLFYVILPAFY